MSSERAYYIELAPSITHDRWRDFEHELNSPAGLFQASFSPAEGDGSRTRLTLRAAAAAEKEPFDDAIRAFRVFLESRGVTS